MGRSNVVVVGCGVTGLTTALLLSRDTRFGVTIIAKHMPGDYDIQYCSPWAGANFMPVSIGGTDAAVWDRETWPYLKHLAQHQPEAGIHFQDLRVYNRKKDVNSATAKWFAELLAPNPWWGALLDNFRPLQPPELGPGVDHGHFATSVCINTAIYLPWLLSQCLKNGVVVKRAEITHLLDAARPGMHHSGRPADLVFNCTGLGARSLGGVMDQTVHPARGQIVVVRNECDGMYSISGTDDGPDEGMYIMGRAAGGGTILGGCYQKDNWESQPDPSLALRIMKRCVEACPALTGGQGVEKLSVIRHGVGLRPARDAGARIEKENIDGCWVVHNYGHGGAGYQSSFGCAKAAVKLACDIVDVGARL